MLRRYTLRHLFILVIFVAALVFVLYTSLVLRDYNISFTGGPHLVAKIAVPPAPGFTINNAVPGKLSVSYSGNAQAYELQLSRSRRMLFGKTYRSELPYKDLGLLKGGKTYYMRARSCVLNDKGRSIHGQWGPIKAVIVREN